MRKLCTAVLAFLIISLNVAYIGVAAIDDLTQPSAVTCATDLRWQPPALENPITRDITAPGTVRLEPGQDYLLRMPRTIRGGVSIRGGRNVVLIGGHIDIPTQPGSAPTISSRRGLYILEQTGTVHVEGLLITGEDLSEAIQLAAPDAIVQLVNIAAYGVHARDQVNFSDNHPDLVQPWGGTAVLRIDYFSGSSDYQGAFLSPDFNTVLGEVRLSHVSFEGLPTARYLFWVAQNTRVGAVHLDQVWIDVPAQRPGGFGKSVWPDVQSPLYPPTISTDLAGNPIAFWTRSTSPIHGWITEGTPPNGHFVPSECVGIGYQSPGYERDSPVFTPTFTPSPTATFTPTATPSPTTTPTPEPSPTVIPTATLAPRLYSANLTFTDEGAWHLWCGLLWGALERLEVAATVECSPGYLDAE